MSEPLVWRVNRKPRFPFLSMAEYMTLEDGPRETMRRNMKYERISPTLLYAKLQISIARFLASPIRDRSILEKCRDDLAAQQESAKSAKAAENAKYALRSLEAFERSLNSLPIGGLNLSLPSRSMPHVIEGVKVSIQPTVLVTVKRSRGADLKGALLVDSAKGDEPKTDRAKARTADAMKHAACLLHEHVVSRMAQQDEKPSKEHCMVFHTHRSELVTCPDNYKTMLKNLRAACRDIATSWENIMPPTSFDPDKASYRN